MVVITARETSQYENLRVKKCDFGRILNKIYTKGIQYDKCIK
jgi:predicted nucleic acid-binding Zn finger protein